jgi:hypothetical protein
MDVADPTGNFWTGSRPGCPAEADLFADRPKVVVEVDDGRYHLTPGQYRRDRRKD